MKKIRFLAFISFLFFSQAWALPQQHLFCQFWSSSTYSPEVINIKNNFEPNELIIQTCVYQKAQAPGIDQVGLCLKLERTSFDLDVATTLEAELISGILGVYRTEKSTKIDLSKGSRDNFIITADMGHSLFTSGLCSWQMPSDNIQ